MQKKLFYKMKDKVTPSYHSRFLLNSTLLFLSTLFNALHLFFWFMVANKLRLENNTFQRTEYVLSIQPDGIQTHVFNFEAR